MMALAAISEGFCPNHHTPLGQDGWCATCGHRGVWYSIRSDDTVVATYAPVVD